MNAKQLQAKLEQFRLEDNFYNSHQCGDIDITDGVKFLCEQLKSYLLVDIVKAFQNDLKVGKEPLQLYNLTVDKKKNVGIVKCLDSNHKILKYQEIKDINIPLEKVRLYFTDNLVLLPSEYINEGIEY